MLLSFKGNHSESPAVLLHRIIHRIYVVLTSQWMESAWDHSNEPPWHCFSRSIFLNNLERTSRSFNLEKPEWIVLFPVVSSVGMACQVSGAVVSAVSAMTIELGRRLAPVIVEKGGKVCLTSCLLLLFYLNVFSLTNNWGWWWTACTLSYASPSIGLSAAV